VFKYITTTKPKDTIVELKKLLRTYTYIGIIFLLNFLDKKKKIIEKLPIKAKNKLIYRKRKPVKLELNGSTLKITNPKETQQRIVANPITKKYCLRLIKQL
jgi:hypothetical protein